MSIIGKYLAKNIFAKPFRTFLLVFCIACCSFVAMLSLDVTGNMEKLVKTMLMQATGTADIIVSDSTGITEPFEIPCENRQLLVFSSTGGFIERSGFYSYFHRTVYQIDNMDYETAYQMRLIPTKLDLKAGETAVSETLSRETGWSEGDDVTLYDSENQPLSYRITAIVPNQGLANNAYILFLNREDYQKLGTGVKANMIYIDILNDNLSNEAKAAIEEADYNAEVSLLLEKGMFQEMLREISSLFLMIFAVCFLLVIFVAVSVSNRIVSERFSVVGTFRSLGISRTFCTGLLITENALYGLLGSLAGLALYLPLRSVIWGSMIQVDSADLDIKMEIPPTRPISFPAVILLCILIMCSCPLKEIIRTSKTAIRDIIFNNKDTAYQTHKASVILGLLCVAGAISASFLKNSQTAQILCFVLIITAVALLFPWLLKAVAGCLGSLFERLGMPIAHLAAKECHARKSTVGSAGLCVTASTLAITIFVLVSTLGSVYDLNTYDCDVIVTANDSQDISRFSYIKELAGVMETEIIFSRESEMKLNGEKTSITVFGLNEGGFRLLSAIKNCPSVLERDSFVIDRSYARRMGLQEGDMVEIVFNADSYLPITKTLRLAAFVDAYEYDSTGNVIVLPKDLYQDMYQACPSRILVRCDDPETIIPQIKKYSATTAESIVTAQEEKQFWKEKESGMRGMLSAVIALGVGLTTIGMISNQLIGFQGRKRECAVLASTSMTREALSKMFLLESMLASGIALLIALPAALTAFSPFRTLLENFGMSANIVYHVKLYILFLAALWIVFTLVALFPIRELKKMNLAAQLKYE